MGGADKTHQTALPTVESDRSCNLKVLAEFDQAPDFENLWSALKDYAEKLGTDLLSYNHRAPKYAPDHANIIFLTHGFPDDWGKRYAGENLHLTDPIAQMLLHSTRAVRWSEIGKESPLSPKQRAYVDEVRAWMTGEGFGIPTFGPSGRQGYVGFGSSHDKLTDWGPLTLNRAQWVAQSFHLRWCELAILSLPKNFTLDDREQAVLKHMAMGMSDEIICGAVSAPLESVRRSVRSIYKKMGVSDRPSAILRGVGVGLVEAPPVNTTLR